MYKAFTILKEVVFNFNEISGDKIWLQFLNIR